MLGLLHPRFRRAFANFPAAVMHAVRDHRPTVVAPRLRLVHLIPAARSVCDCPEPTAIIKRCTLCVAMAERPDFRQSAAICEGVVLRDRTIAIDADDLAIMALNILRGRAVTAIANGQIECAVIGLHNPAAIVLGLVCSVFLTENHTKVRQAVRAQFGHCKRGFAATARRLGEGQKNLAGLRKIAGWHNIQEPTLPLRINVRQSFDPLGPFARFYVDQAAVPLCDQDRAIGQETEGPRRVEA